jgi:hypothetical protein
LLEFETQYRHAQSSGEYPPDAEIVKALHSMASLSLPVAAAGVAGD